MYPFMNPYNWYLTANNTTQPINMPENMNSYEELQNFVEQNVNNMGNTMGNPTGNMMDNTMGGDPPPILSNNPVTAALTLRKELTGYPNYGNPSGNADILYMGNTGTWNFTLPPFFSAVIGRFRRVELVLRGALDDHYNVPENTYRMTLNFNGTPINLGPLPFVHGRPLGQRFTNWNQLVLRIPPNIMRANNRIVIRNTSNNGADDFFAFDWMEIRLFL